MNRSYLLVVLPFLLFVIFFSCQKELDDSKDPNSKGSLVKDSAGNCSLMTVTGDYVAAKVVNDSNKIAVTVNVTKAGNYSIRTDSVNGYSFRSAGSFATIGRQVVRLTGTGKPANVGINHFNVYYDTSICQIDITVRPAIPPATITLSGAPNGCTNATLSGTFTKGVSLDSSSYLSITINVSTAGTYAITTNTVNDFSFSGSDILLTTGMQSVRLYASGTPANAAIDTFAIVANGNVCHFTVPVLLQVDYFPLTANSYWVYDNLYNPADSIIRTITGTSATGGGVYNVMQEQKVYSSQQFLFRKSGSDYLEYGQNTKYTTSIVYRNMLSVNFNFLKTNVSTGTTWQSPEYTDTASFGQVISLRYNYVCEDASAVVTINGQTFTNVCKILMYPEIKAQGNYWGNTSEYYFSSYAKDIGLIYEKKMNNNFTISEMAIRRWRVY